MSGRDLTRFTLHAAYRSGELTPRALVAKLLAEAAARGSDPTWIRRLTVDELEPYLAALDGESPETLPLYGLPFAIKDNIDLAGIPTTAGCPAFAYVPTRHAFVVEQLIAAGAIPLGKTNLDQFATGLVGERAPAEYGVPGNAFDPDYIPGGSSSGSAVAAAAGQVSFALGTDTAGSGRVPACFNNLFGLKPTVGLLSNRGVVPACRSIDTISLFALTADDAQAILDVAAVFDGDCAEARAHDFAIAGQRYGRPPAHFRFGVPPRDQWQTDAAYSRCMETAIGELRALGGEPVEIDCTPMLEAAQLLYGGPWVAERYHAVRSLIERSPDALHPVTRQVIEGGRAPSALDAFDAGYRLSEHKRAADRLLAEVDVMLAPTTVAHPSKAAVAAEPVAVNTRLGTWTNFMNLLDYSALAVPIAIGENGRPGGVTLFGPAFADLSLLSLARALEARLDLPLGATGRPRPALPALPPAGDGTLEIAVCGAHLDGLALNHQLVERGGRRTAVTETAPRYRLFALTADQPPRPALIEDAEAGQAIAVELWRLPMASIGSFLAGIPAPLGLGRVTLADDRSVTGFICAAGALDSQAEVIEISAFGGWRAWLASTTEQEIC
ncbi:allophanate hydrolase [Salinisphaera hydrothermalis]|uniref:allophanate hydrolase n=1 Tax=Salinisphaera hydrothermalis TaxID=563188 RepID=UPI003340FBFD